MKKASFLILFLFLSCCSFGQLDTLFMYDPGVGKVKSNGTFDLRVARFDISQTGNLKELLIYTDGDSGEVTIRLFGHEGGTAFPQLLEDLIDPITIKKGKNGLQILSVKIQDEIVFKNNQFFVGIEQPSSGMYILQGGKVTLPSCESSSGGNYYHKYLLKNGSWSYNARALAIDAVLKVHPTPAYTYFRDVTDTAKIVGSGDRIAIADFNGDGLDDILQGGKLLKNHWWDGYQFIDESAMRGISGSPRANAFMDMDNDGDLDILFLESSDSNFIFINDGSGYFTRKLLEGIPINSLDRINTMSIADINNDGYPDLFVGQLWATYPNALPKFLFMNTGNNDFVDTSTLLYPTDNFEKNAPCRGSQFVDFNNDGCIDLFVANYVTTASKTTSPRDELWKNNGDGTFTNVIGQTPIDDTKGASFWNMSSGCHWGDYDNDGDMDLLAPTLSHPRYMNGNSGEYTKPTTIYRNNLNGQNFSFESMEGSHGIEYEETHAGASWGDFNNDGLLDFFISTFYGCRYNDIYLQNEDHSFSLHTWQAGLEGIRGNQDGLWLDVDNDGKLELMAGGKLFKNEGPYFGNWVRLKALANKGNKFAIGAKVIVFAGGDQFTREVSTGQGQKMQSSYSLHFGLGERASIDSVKVIWPGCERRSTVFTNISINNVHTLLEDGSFSTSLVDKEKTKLVVFPNPFDDELSISGGIIQQIKLTNQLGKEQSIQIDLLGKEIRIIPMEKLPLGIYYLRALVADKWHSFAVIKS